MANHARLVKPHEISTAACAVEPGHVGETREEASARDPRRRRAPHVSVVYVSDAVPRKAANKNTSAPWTGDERSRSAAAAAAAPHGRPVPNSREPVRYGVLLLVPTACCGGVVRWWRRAATESGLSPHVRDGTGRDGNGDQTMGWEHGRDFSDLAGSPRPHGPPSSRHGHYTRQ